MKKILSILLLISSFAKAQIIKQKQVLGLQDSLTAIRAAGGGGSSPVGVDSLTGWAMQFDANKGHNIFHGYMWDPADSFYHFFFQAWVVPDTITGTPTWTGYILSADNGGAHTLLAGVSASGSTFSITGNVNTGVGPIGDYTFTGVDNMPMNTLHHVAVGYDGAQLVCFIDGVPSGKTPYTRWRTANSPRFYIGCSDHSNFNGKILRYQLYEDQCPVSLSTPFTPSWVFNDNAPSCVLSSDLTTPSNVIADNSPGFYGIKHTGIRNSIAPSVYSPFGSTNNSINIALDGRADSLLPQWVKYKFQQPVYTGGSPTIPGSAIIYDEFSRADQTATWSNTIGLDSTEGGTAGKKKYLLNTQTDNGILNKQAYLNTAGGNDNWVTVSTGVGNQDVRVTSTIGDKQILVFARYTDVNNYVAMSVFGNTVYMYKHVAGVETIFSTYTTAGFSELKVVVSASTASFYEDGVLKLGGASIGDVPSGQRAGWGVRNASIARIDKWEVY